MKEIVKMSRLTGMLEKMYRALNADFFEGKLEMPVITVSPSSRSYAHFTAYNAWETSGKGKPEINIASGTLDRPIEEIAASMVHEMCHYWNYSIMRVQDCSRGGMYHNRAFKNAAENHGLICETMGSYGWAHTEPSEALLDWVIEHDEFREVEMCRVNEGYAVGTGSHSSEKGSTPVIGTRNSHSRKYACPKCGNSVRATKEVRIICADCMEHMIEC